MSPLFGFFEGALSPSHLIVVLVVGFLLFGRKFPEMGRYLGKGIVEFKKGLRGIEDELEGATAPPPGPPAEQAPPPHRRHKTPPPIVCPTRARPPPQPGTS
jgi:sec-independent protein translocase protein TatA